MSIESKWAEMARKPAPVTLPSIKREKKKRRHNISGEQRLVRAERMRNLWNQPGFREKHKAAAQKANARWLADPQEKARRVAAMHSDETKRLARVRLALAEYYSDPENLRRHSEMSKARWADPEKVKKRKKCRLSRKGLIKIRAAAQRSHDKRRGFAIPPMMRSQYNYLRTVKKFRAREVGIMLGLISENGKPLMQKQAA